MPFPTKDEAATPIVNPVVGQRSMAKLLNKKRHLRHRVTIEAEVNVTTAGTDILNRGSVLAAFDEAGLIENGNKERWAGLPLVLQHYSRALSAGPDSPLRLTKAQATAIGVYPVRETFYMNYALPHIGSPTETVFREADTQAFLEAFVKYNGRAGMLVKGGVAALQNVKVRIHQFFDNKIEELGVFIPTVEQISRPIAVANAAEEISIASDRYMAGIIVSQWSDIGEVEDMIAGIAIRGDNDAISGPVPSNWADHVRGQHAIGGGRLDETLAHCFFQWVRNGRLSTVYNPTADRNLRLVLDVKPSATVGATNSKILVHKLTFERVSGIVQDPMPFFA